MVETKDQLKDASELIGSGEIDFYDGLPQKDLDEILGTRYKLFDAMIIREYKGKFGLSDFSLLALEDTETGEQFTTLAGGIVLVKRVDQLVAGEYLPCGVTITMAKDRYYTIK